MIRHRDAEVVAQLGGPGRQLLGVLACGVDVVDAAGAHDHEQAVIGAVQDARDVGAAAEDDLGLVVGERELVEQVRRGRERHRALDAQVAYLLEMARRVHGDYKPFRGSPVVATAPGC